MATVSSCTKKKNTERLLPTYLSRSECNLCRRHGQKMHSPELRYAVHSLSSPAPAFPFLRTKLCHKLEGLDICKDGVVDPNAFLLAVKAFSHMTIMFGESERTLSALQIRNIKFSSSSSSREFLMHRNHKGTEPILPELHPCIGYGTWRLTH